MSVRPDHWIRQMAQEKGMIEPFVDGFKRDGVISYGVSSYGYDARVADGKDAAEAMLAEASAPELDVVIVGPYLIDVEQQGTDLVPTKYREVLRTKGPSVREDLGYQAV